MIKGLMDRCLSQETMVDCLMTKVEKTEELTELKAWKVVQENKLALAEKLLNELEKQTEVLRKVLKDKEGEISKSKKQLCQSKEDAIKEYHDSDTFIKELGWSFADGFDDCFHQVKASFPDLDLSHISINAPTQTLTLLTDSKGTHELFADDSTPDPQGDEEITPHKD